MTTDLGLRVNGKVGVIRVLVQVSKTPQTSRQGPISRTVPGQHEHDTVADINPALP